MSETTEEQTAPSVEDLDAQIIADEAAREEPEVTEPTPEPEPQPEIGTETTDEETEVEKRISRLAYEKRQAEKQAREFKARLDRLEGNAPQLPQDEATREMIQRQAAEMAATQAYNNRANAIYADGVKAYPDFAMKLEAWKDIGGIPTVLVEAVDELGDAHKIIHYLSKNIDEAERIVGMPPHKMGAALAKVSHQIATTPQQSKAPSPIKPISGTVKAEVKDEDLSIAEYCRREDERWAQRKYRR